MYDEYPIDENSPRFYAADRGKYERTRCSLASHGNYQTSKHQKIAHNVLSIFDKLEKSRWRFKASSFKNMITAICQNLELLVCG